MEHKPEYADNDQTIFRKPKDKEHPYVVISKTVFEDTALSWKAKGMMGYLLSRPDDWTIILGDLIKRSPEGRGAVRSILRELEQHGYLLKRTLRGDDGRWAGTEMIVLEHPAPLEQRTYKPPATRAQTPTTDEPHAENPHTVEPHTDECPLLSIDPVPSIDLTEEEPEPPAADSLPDVSFYPEGETPPEPKTASHEPPEQRLARLRDQYHVTPRENVAVPTEIIAVVEKNRAAVEHPDFGDARKDGDPWQAPVREFCALIITPYENVPDGKRRLWANDIHDLCLTSETGAGPEKVSKAIRSIAMCDDYDWLRTCNRPTHGGFASALLSGLWGQKLPQNGTGRHDGGAGGQASQIDPEKLRIYNEQMAGRRVGA